MSGAEQAVAIRVDDGQAVSGLWLSPDAARAAFVFAHGAGAGMAHPFMSAFAQGLARRGIATLRYQFPYMERGSKRVDAPALAQATVRAAVDAAARLAPGLPLLAGGKSFGARMSSQAQAASPLPGVRGLVFVGFPLHPAKKPATERGDHLLQVRCPMLFLQGTRDELAEMALVTPLVQQLGDRATLFVVDDADHSFHVRASSGRNDAQAMDTMLDAVSAWLAGEALASAP
jgi:predicted alpha/beta-hydrolase family hydrolase